MNSTINKGGIDKQERDLVLWIHPIHSLDLPIMHWMRRLFKIKREKSPKPPLNSPSSRENLLISLLCHLISEQSWMITLTVGGDFPARFWWQILLIQRYYQMKEGRLVHESCFRMGWMQINSFPHREFSHEMGMPTCVQTPSTTSTRTSAPSHSREAIETSLLNAPGIVDSGVI